MRNNTVGDLHWVIKKQVQPLFVWVDVLNLIEFVLLVKRYPA